MIKISVENLKNVKDKNISFSEKFDLPDGYGFLQESTIVDFTGKIVQNGKNYNLVGNFTCEVQFECNSCLENVSLTIGGPVEECFSNDNLVNDSQYIDDAEINYFSGHEIDIYSVILSNILLNIPLKVVCKDDCKGLCVQCGTNLNLSDCDCKADIDPRLAGLKDLLK
ncbi:MAG: YceD family protein [Lachnospirales bacterium]